MAGAGEEEDTDAILSDVEADDPVPSIQGNSSPQEFSADRFRETLAELERERELRKLAEESKSELQVSFNRLKVLAHEAIKKRDECLRKQDEAVREKEHVLREKDEALKQRDESVRQLDEAVKARDSSRSEIEVSAQLLVTGIDKITGKIGNFKTFSGGVGGLPRSQKYSGLPAIAYGIVKRTNEIVEELLRQIEAATKSRNDARGQMEQRNYEIAIEVSQLEATISGLREENAKKTNEVENLEKLMKEMDREMSEKLSLAENEVEELRRIGEEFHDKLRSLESKVDMQRPILIDQWNYVSKARNRISEIIKIVDVDGLDEYDFSESLYMSKEMDMDEIVQASLDETKSIYHLTKVAAERVRDETGEKCREIKRLDENVERLVTEKQHIGSLLRSALSRNMGSDPSSETSKVFQVAENGLREAGIEFRFDYVLGNGDKSGASEIEDDEVCTLAGALENIVKAYQLQIIELQHSMEALRAESSLLKAHLEVQEKELNQRKHQIKELEDKERVANENVEGLMMDIAAAEEEIVRWKVAAEQEAAAGRAVEQEFKAQLSALQQELETAKQAMLESENKLKFKEETATAAMAARDAAEKSLRLADTRASRLRERLEELTRQLEELDNREDSRGLNRQRYVCWPWQWLGLNFVGNQAITQQNSNEMELSEPLL